MQSVSSGTVSFTIPDGWGHQRSPQGVILAAPGRHGFQPNVVVRESVARSSLPALAQADAAAVAVDIPDAYVYRVTAEDGPTGERRQIFALAPVEIQATRVTLYVVQQLHVVDGVAVEATATVPLLFGSEIRDELHAVLDSATPTPPAQRRTPATASAIVAAEPDPRASARAAREVESLQGLHGTQPFTIGPSQRRVSAEAVRQLLEVCGGGRLFQPRVARGSEAFDILRVCELIDERGALTPAGGRVAELHRQGRAWGIERDRGSAHRRLRCWTYQGSTLVIADPTPLDDAAGRGDVLRLGVVGPDELLRVIYAWADLSPSWPGTDALPAQRIETLLSKVAGTSRLAADGSALAAADWEYAVVSVDGVTDENVAWIWADGVGPALPIPSGDKYVLTEAGADALPERVSDFLRRHLPLTEPAE